jgi:glycosyltransferase involved in cell wall biosynthesis
MKILLTADAELPVPPENYGGIERIVDLLVREFESGGHVVALVAHPDSTSPASQCYGWPGRTSTRRWDSAINSLALRRAVADFNPDVIHSFSRLLWLAPLAADRRPKVMSYQREPAGRTVAWSRRLHRGRLRFTGCSEYICRNGRMRGGGDWTAIPNCVDMKAYDFVATIPDDAPLVFLSRIEPIKGAHIAIEVAKRSGRRLLIAGNHADVGPLGDYWREHILPEVGRNGIEYVGVVNDRQKNELLGRAAALIVPIQWNEPFGIVFVEALACGTPVITCPRGATPEIIENGVHGFLVKDVEQGLAAVKRLSTIDRGRCRMRVERDFSSSGAAFAYCELYQQMFNANPAAQLSFV